LGGPEAGAALVITLKPASVSVSAVSALLREVQAALREAARADPESSSLFEGDQPPVLNVRFDGTADGVSLAFDFVDASTRAPIEQVSRVAGRRLVAALERELKRRPQRTLWGQAGVSARRRPTDAESDPLSGRAAVVLSELGRVTGAAVAGAGRRIRLEGETAEIL
jgi:hypothetical protein